MTTPAFTTDAIAVAVQLHGPGDDFSVYLLRDGTLVNRWNNGPPRRRRAAQDWITQHGEAFQAVNTDLLDEGGAP